MLIISCWFYTKLKISSQQLFTLLKIVAQCWSDEMIILFANHKVKLSMVFNLGVFCLFYQNLMFTFSKHQTQETNNERKPKKKSFKVEIFSVCVFIFLFFLFFSFFNSDKSNFLSSLFLLLLLFFCCFVCFVCSWNKVILLLCLFNSLKFTNKIF